MIQVTARDGVFPLVAMAEGKNALAPRAVLHRHPEARLIQAFLPTELNGRVGTVDMLSPPHRTTTWWQFPRQTSR